MGKRTKDLYFRMTEKEYEEAAKSAEESGQTVPEFIRNRAMNVVAASDEKEQELVAASGKLKEIVDRFNEMEKETFFMAQKAENEGVLPSLEDIRRLRCDLGRLMEEATRALAVQPA